MCHRSCSARRTDHKAAMVTAVAVKTTITRLSARRLSIATTIIQSTLLNDIMVFVGPLGIILRVDGQYSI